MAATRRQTFQQMREEAMSLGYVPQHHWYQFFDLLSSTHEDLESLIVLQNQTNMLLQKLSQTLRAPVLPPPPPPLIVPVRPAIQAVRSTPYEHHSFRLASTSATEGRVNVPPQAQLIILTPITADLLIELDAAISTAIPPIKVGEALVITYMLTVIHHQVTTAYGNSNTTGFLRIFTFW